jgi:hypothetical protein
VSLSYNLELADKTLTVEQLKSEVHAAASAAGVVAPDDSRLVRPGEALVLSSGANIDVLSKRQANDAIKDEFGIDSRIAVRFGLTRHADYDQQEAQMVSVVDALLKRVPDDALLHRDYYDIFLLRQNGQVYLDADDRWWSEMLHLIHTPYQRKQLRFSYWEPDDEHE